MKFISILSIGTGSHIYWLITCILFSLGCATSLAQGVDSTSVEGTDPDSITYIMGNDTLKLNRVFSIQHPAYSPISDTSQTPSSNNNPAYQQESGLDAVGSITRGIQVSSNSSVSLQSSMYLKIKGNLSDDYTVQGVLTDKTSPLQPIGNTRRLNDFERVMVEVDGPALNAAIGDIDLRLDNGKFGRVDRSIEGLSISTKSNKGALSGALGFSYGEYHLLQIQGKNGKQGPYRLSGRNGEKFIIILAGSEKIKLDDHLLIRGEDDDYIIDYNAAEIHFTQNHILSSNSRISVEFEYVQDIYLASYSFGKQLISGEVSLGNQDDSPFFISAAWQDIRDDENNPLGNIEAEQLQQIFGDLGTDVALAELSGIHPDSGNGNYNLTTDGILVFTGEEPGNYSVDFSFVGLDKGQYRKDQNATGQYYVYDPVNGEYFPSQQYVAPQGLSVFSLSGHVKKSHVEAIFDFGVSQDTKNLYAADPSGIQKVAWDIKGGVSRPNFEIRLGDKYYEAGYTSHDALETLEYYRRWHLDSRKGEAENLRYGQVRLGNQNFFKAAVSQMERSSSLVGQQVQIDSRTNPAAPLTAQYSSTLTQLDSTLSQSHNFRTAYTRNKVTTDFNLDVEDGSASTHYASNDHLSSGVQLAYEHSDKHTFLIQYDRRLDYRLSEPNQTIFSSKNMDKWSDRREDWISKYHFDDFLNSKGQINLKYREHTSDSGAVKQYYLGNFQISGNAINNQLRFQEHYLLDEEHIPKYDYHYIEVDTGYGDYSFDPAIQDYIPLQSGRFVRQRIFSDREEQVRKYDNKTRLEYASKSYGELEKIAFKSRFGYEFKLKQEVQSNTTIQNQSSVSFDLDVQTGQTSNFTSVSYSGKSTRNSSSLYNYGKEENSYFSHDVNGTFSWNPRNQSKTGIIFETRERQLEYNPLAHEYWNSSRPFANHILKISAKQKLEFDLKYSLVRDQQIDKVYNEYFVQVKHSLRYKRRGRVDQQVSLSQIQADVQAIPYSVFSGRQPGDNWKYSLNGRYTFSSMFQLSMNYSIQKRGDNESEQYLRIEGRSHF